MSQRPIDDPSAEAKGTFARYWDGRAPSFDSQPQHTSQSDEETDAWKAILVKLSGGVVGTSALEVGTETGFTGHRVSGGDMEDPTGMLREKAILLAKIGHRVTGIDGIFSLDRNSWDKPSREAFDGLPHGAPGGGEHDGASGAVCTLDALVAIKQRIPRWYLVWAPGARGPLRSNRRGQA